jgi:tRNA(Ile2) C34 agmatinyltransferase TiaS
MPQNTPPPRCPKCGKRMHFIIVRSGGRKFKCVQCDGADPLKMTDIRGWLASELQPPKPE